MQPWLGWHVQADPGGDAPVTDTVPAPGSGLAAQALLAREEELSQLESLVLDPTVRLVTVTGPTGVGKSHLAATLEDRLRRQGVEDVVHVALSGVPDRGLVSDAVVAAVGSADPLITIPVQALWERHRGAPVLLVLDDVVPAVQGLNGFFEEMLAGYPELTVLATSARRLGVAHEAVLRLAPFPPATMAPQDPAVMLFARCALAADPRFELDDSTRAAVVAVCREVGGLPLAIEIAAARISAVPPQLMAEQLSTSTVDLVRRVDGDDDVPERHRSLRAAVAWTVSLLPPATRATWVQLAVFEGAFPVDAAGAVVYPPIATAELLDRLSDLIDSHLVQVDLADGHEVSFSLPQYSRGWAREALASDAEEDRIRDAHASYWGRRCLVDPEAAIASWPDVLAAVDRSMALGRHDEALQLAAIAALSAQGSPGAEASLLPLLEEALEDPTVDSALRARSLMWATSHRGSQAEASQAFGEWTSQRLARSVELARLSGDDAALLAALELTISSLGITFDIAAALGAAYEGRELAARLGDEAALARFEVWTAMAQRVGGDSAGAARSLRSAFERGQRVDDVVAVVYSATLLRDLPIEEWGPFELPSLEELLTRAEQRRHALLVMHVLAAMIARDLDDDDLVAAARSLARMLLVAETLHDTWPMASVAPLALLVRLAVQGGRYDAAVPLRECLRPLEPLMPGIAPSLMPPYVAAVAQLEAAVPRERYEELRGEMAGTTLLEANRRAQLILRTTFARADSPRTASSPQPPSSAARAPAALTPRELDVMLQLTTGASNRAIAEALGMSPKTVMHHTVSIYRKLGVQGRAEAVAWAFRTGLASSD